ncbi:MAG: hypothetical protein KGQ37_09420 [Hyphomicrobiales bacterium]|nr:hypothetical protein [Hyphomicrobiales bacterium]
MSATYPLPKGTRQVTPDYACDGVLTAFAIPFRFFDPTDIYVATSTTGPNGFVQAQLGTAYTISGAGSAGGGTVNFIAPPPAGLVRVMGLRTPSRLTSVVNGGALIAAALENELDVQEMTLQELRRDINVAMANALAAVQAAVLAGMIPTGSLPTVLPAAPGVLWNNGGVVSIS